MLSDKEKFEKYADTMIEVGTKIKEFINEDFLNKPESELTAEENNKYYQFVGYYISAIQKLNEIRINLL